MIFRLFLFIYDKMHKLHGFYGAEIMMRRHNVKQVRVAVKLGPACIHTVRSRSASVLLHSASLNAVQTQRKVMSRRSRCTVCSAAGAAVFLSPLDSLLSPIYLHPSSRMFFNGCFQSLLLPALVDRFSPLPRCRQVRRQKGSSRSIHYTKR